MHNLDNIRVSNLDIEKELKLEYENSEAVLKSIFGEAIGDDLLSQNYYFASEIRPDEYIVYRQDKNGEIVKEQIKCQRYYNAIEDYDGIILNTYSCDNELIKTIDYEDSFKRL